MNYKRFIFETIALETDEISGNLKVTYGKKDYR